MKMAKVFLFAAALALFAVGGCIGSDNADDAEVNTSEADVDAGDNVETSESMERASSSDEDSEFDPDPGDINNDHLDAGIPDGFPDVIPVYDIAHSTVMGGMGVDAEGTMIYNLTLGSNDQISEVYDFVLGSFENISMDLSDEGSLLIAGEMEDWEYTITAESGEANGFTTIITYSLIKNQ